jgi:hypothetical protein
LTQTALQQSAEPATLSRDFSEFLIEMSIGVHRHAMYPPGHPSLDPIVENVIARLGELFAGEHRTLSIGVAARQLVIEGVATDAKHPVLADLAERLHRHQLGAISFEMGVTATEIAGVLAAIAQEHEREGTPIGLLDAADFPSWPHARLYRVGYDQLALKGDAEGGGGGTMERATALWLGLAQAALATDEPVAEAPDARVIADSIQGHRREAAYDQVIVGYLKQLAEELKDDSSADSAKIRARVSKLMNELDDDTLARLVHFGGNAKQRTRFVLDANQTLAVDSVVKLLQAAAQSSEQTISTSMTRMLGKLAIHAEQGTGLVRSQADTALRENVEHLIENWELKDPNPEAYTNVLDAMSRSAPVFQAPVAQEEITGAERLVQMALEVDAFGPTINKAVADLADAGMTGDLLRMLSQVDEGNSVAARIRKQLTSPTQFRRLLTAGQIDMASLRSLMDEMGSGAVDPLLDVLAESDSRSVRRRVFDALSGLGPFVAQRAIERLEDHRWFVLRNMLALLARLEHIPDDFDPQPYLEHPDHRVRREALPLAMRPGSRLRDRALVSALADSDERMVRMALLQLQDRVPEPTLPTLVNRVVSAEGRSAEIRSLALRCLATSKTTLARSTLLEVVLAGKTLLGKPKLAGKSQLLLSALRALATGWGGRDDVDQVLDAARASKDPEIRGAVRVSSRGAAS